MGGGGGGGLGGNTLLSTRSEKNNTNDGFGLSKRTVEVRQLEGDNRRGEKRLHVLSTLSQPINWMFCTF